MNTCERLCSAERAQLAFLAAFRLPQLGATTKPNNNPAHSHSAHQTPALRSRPICPPVCLSVCLSVCGSLSSWAKCERFSAFLIRLKSRPFFCKKL